MTELLGIKYPIMCGGMNVLTRAELAAAVSNAGALGMITSAWLETPERLREEIRKTKNLTDKPFGVNISLFPSVKPLPNKEFIEVICEEGVKVIETAGHKSPQELASRLKENKVIIIHKAAAVRHCLAGEQDGADMLSIVGVENGGNIGLEDVAACILIPCLADMAKIPIIAGGGFADGRSLVAALSLGADGIVMGTRFIATQECIAHHKYKEWLVEATERDTVMVMRAIGHTHRALKSKVTEKLAELEARGATFEEMYPIIGGPTRRKVALEGKLDIGLALAGQGVGLIHDIPTVTELIDRIIGQANEVLEHLGKIRIYN
jgi:nitronate monooxygenase